MEETIILEVKVKIAYSSSDEKKRAINDAKKCVLGVTIGGLNYLVKPYAAKVQKKKITK